MGLYAGLIDFSDPVTFPPQRWRQLAKRAPDARLTEARPPERLGGRKSRGWTGAPQRKDDRLAGFSGTNGGWRGGFSRVSLAAVLVAAWLAPNSTESAVANGDTRTVAFANSHTNESGSFTYMVNGVYDQGMLDKLNWFLRDWRLDEPTKMDPHL